ncbi:hypothetical protein AAFF_G00043220 [Aldrovandia affinis]|uniref:Uncharacterized protein n=1 Tax=Aldrovandia affinis TaxID=143900 RepID=A0AAD7WF42_9TELE|nr:hypothetical protein AAFF_G00043220 [Aldrovandia affinis]
MLWDEVKRKLASLRRAERICKRRKRKEKERANFFKNPFKHARQLLEDKKSGKLEVTKEKLEQHIRGQYSNPARNNSFQGMSPVLPHQPPSSTSCSPSSAKSERLSKRQAFEIILIGARQMVGRIKLQSGQRLPPLKSYMDDITNILQTAACRMRLLKRLDELVSWARMKIKPSKSRSLSLRKGVKNDNTIFVAGLFGRNILQLPLQSISLGSKQGKTRLVQELRESTDQLVRCADAQVRTGRKWKAQVEVDQAISRLQHLEVVGRVQAGRTGLGWGEALRFWSKANRKERKEMVVSEVTKIEEERYKI